MSDSALPRIWTGREVAEYFKVGDEVIVSELENGKLNGFKVGQEWRCSDSDLLAYMTRTRTRIETEESELVPRPDQNTWNIVDIGPFDFDWPEQGGSKPEHYDKGYSATGLIDGQQYTFRLGFGNRKAAGMMRRRVTIWLGNRALVEFAGSNDYESDDLLASVIRLKNNKQLSASYQRIPGDYRNFEVRRYNSIVKGPRASTSMAVVVNKDDLKSMLEHAIIRARWKKII